MKWKLIAFVEGEDCPSSQLCITYLSPETCQSSPSDRHVLVKSSIRLISRHRILQIHLVIRWMPGVAVALRQCAAVYTVRAS